MKLLKTTLVMAAATISAAAQVNVSKIVTGQYTVPLGGLYIPNGAPAANITYYPAVHAKVGPDTYDMYPGPWPTAASNSVSHPTIKRQTNSPGSQPLPDGGSVSYYKPYFELASVGVANNKQTTNASVYRTGSSTASTSYNVKIEHFGAGSHDYYLNLTVPQITRFVNAAYNLVPGSNGGTYVFLAPKKAASRASVDVYADGLPIWSSESVYRFPDDSPNHGAKFEYKWGSTQAANSVVSLYLGRFSTGQSVRISVVVRTDARSEANTCGSEVSGMYETRHCFDLRQTVDLVPNSATGLPGMYVHSRSYVVSRF